MPSKAVESLPWDMPLGGMQRVDIPAQVQALQAKVAAMLLHPRRHAWKVLMQRAFQRYVPALGPAAFVSTYAPANKAGRCSRHVAYWRATYIHTYIHYCVVLVASWPWSPAPLLAVCPRITTCLASQRLRRYS
jgi:hypothetical protein